MVLVATKTKVFDSDQPREPWKKVFVPADLKLQTATYQPKTSLADPQSKIDLEDDVGYDADCYHEGDALSDSRLQTARHQPKTSLADVTKVDQLGRLGKYHGDLCHEEGKKLEGRRTGIYTLLKPACTCSAGGSFTCQHRAFRSRQWPMVGVSNL